MVFLFSIFCSKELLVMYLLNLLLTENVHFVLVFLFSTFKDVVSVLCCFWLEVSYYYPCFPYVMFYFFLGLLSRFSFWFAAVQSWCLFILLMVHWASWICKSVFLIKFGKFSGIISLNFFFLQSHSLFLGLYYIY